MRPYSSPLDTRPAYRHASKRVEGQLKEMGEKSEKKKLEVRPTFLSDRVY